MNQRKLSLYYIGKQIKCFIKDAIWVIKNRNNRDAESLLYLRSSGCAIRNICKKIRNSYGNRAMTIFHAKRAGWWDQDDKTTCDEILKSPGNRAATIYYAKQAGWWVYDNDLTCKCILEAPGDLAMAIFLAKQDGWWIYDDETTTKQIMEFLSNNNSVLIGTRLLESSNWWKPAVN